MRNVVCTAAAGGLFLLTSTMAFAEGADSHAGDAAEHAAPQAAAHATPHWGYDGAEGPDNWASLSSDFAACEGSQQSPIDLRATHEADNEDIQLNWTPFAPMVVNNGHTIQANAPEGNTAIFGDMTYSLKQMHFHHQSEHAISGKLSPMEAHFVHAADDGSLMVLGVMIEEGPENPEIAKIWASAPESTGETQSPSPVSLLNLLPPDAERYRYSGSLTTPPCSEIVNWVVFKTPITASKAQIDAFARLFPKNNRPLQALNRRFVLIGK